MCLVSGMDILKLDLFPSPFLSWDIIHLPFLPDPFFRILESFCVYTSAINQNNPLIIDKNDFLLILSRTVISSLNRFLSFKTLSSHFSPFVLIILSCRGY